VSLINILVVCLVYFVTSVFSVSVGGTSLITVPLLMSFGMTPKNAVATNMFALIFLSISGAIRFKKEIRITHCKMIFFFCMLTICGSIIGANLILAIDENLLDKMIAIMICVIALSFFLKRELGIQRRKERISKMHFVAGALLIFILGIYGGFFSGGYVTLLSYVLILIFGLNFLQVAFVTKIFNIFSSLVACAFFYYHSLIEFHVGVPLAVSASLGAVLGATLAIRKGNLWVRKVFLIAAMVLAVKLLFL